jgi:membrane protein YdbS with pleckstrin-like domain|uniref:Uncharacterized protein n=1 Tax=Myoviridae sp. ctu2j3 TaxID=2825197 RepID=A0A8S5UHR4_9CAUD|nr:MAG TPA: hypothetical protein [Myoviridae sp. ctu2j3]DAF94074.1 MAG TPA: hypothetical protein [Myoviridae sp. ctu2j3]
MQVPIMLLLLLSVSAAFGFSWAGHGPSWAPYAYCAVIVLILAHPWFREKEILHDD